jgi:uncharacterized membrane protein
MAADVSVTPGRWIGMGWSVFKQDVGNLILVALIGLALVSFSAFVVTGPVLAGFFLVVRRRMLEGRTDLNDLFAGFGQFIDALLISLLTALFLFAGLCLCIVPVFIVAGLYLFSYLFLVDRRLSFWDAMESSRKIAAQNLIGYTMFAVLLVFLNVAGFAVLAFLNVAGFFLAGLGLLVTVPVSVAAVAVAYKETVGFEYQPVQSHGPVHIP